MLTPIGSFLLILWACSASILTLAGSSDSSAQAAPTHWAFTPLTYGTPPPDETGGWARNGIDIFIWNKLRAHGLTPSERADKRTLARRLYLGITGLLPSPEEVFAFEKSNNPTAIDELVDRLLASPHYGERWARHWLDVIRFAESNGFETNTPRKNAWPFRDWVIHALNRNMPYDQFIRFQLTGDLHGEDAATGFLVAGAWDEVKSPDPVLTAQQRMDELHDVVSTTGSSFLGLTIGCARCHNHKFDPISQKDYYAVQAIFAGVQHGERTLVTEESTKRKAEAARLEPELRELQNALLGLQPLAADSIKNDLKAGKDRLRPPVTPVLNVERIAPIKVAAIRFTIEETTQLEPCLDELEVYSHGSNVARTATLSASGTYPDSEIHKLEHLNDGNYGNSKSWISNEKGKGWVELRWKQPVEIDQIHWGRDRLRKFNDRLATKYSIDAQDERGLWRRVASDNDRLPHGETHDPYFWLDSEARARALELEKKKSHFEKRIADLMADQKIYAGRFQAPPLTHRLQRGEPLQPREVVAPGSLTKFPLYFTLSTNALEQERRAAFAHWLITNPLTARVMANRLWQWHFGEGIVGTPSDFGLNGAAPSNLELLDYLASNLIKSGWNIKTLQRLILTSATFQQASTFRAEAAKIDAQNSLFWRFSPRRLEAETLRDTILQATGLLNHRGGGPGFDLFEPNDNYVRVFNPKTAFGPGEFRRMIYLTKHRTQLDDTFGAFDCPDAGQIAPKRNRSITALQALNLFNSPFMTEQADYFAKRLQQEVGDVPNAQAERAFQILFSRPPTGQELQKAAALIRTHGLTSFCRAMFNANEFVFLF